LVGGDCEMVFYIMFKVIGLNACLVLKKTKKMSARKKQENRFIFQFLRGTWEDI